MLKKGVVFLILGLICLGPVGVVFAEGPEKIKESIEFIDKKTTIQRKCTVGSIEMYCFQKLKFSKEGCQIGSTQLYSEDKFGEIKTTFAGQANLKDMNPKRIGVAENEIQLYTTNARKKVLNVKDGKSEMAEIFYLFTDDPADAKSVAQAFSFLVEVCGGKEDDF